ncbi:hypothetical protein BDB00DRAFT_869237 [Zychaea mexicana]|uniref:uncharacterized protein n=1 Tax=Zychaea mexicana TaxID=64656 RepID=UPI0022FE137F|nr:uncharacterized protein BDB00DRAFT_869237 [Zychaea mexicana]KAI9496659.1 hypothetical protein BDB00DRAFT_869237 [Zychaea mexicana]
MSQSRKRHRGQPGNDRKFYLSQLVQEYHTTKDIEAKQQVLANLGNFAYDSINHNWLWQANAIDVFFDALEQQDSLLQEFGAGGIANICLDPQHYQYILSNTKHIESINAIVEDGTRHDTSTTTDAVVNAMTTLMLLINDTSHQVILTDALKTSLLRLKQNRQVDTRIITVATLFLTDYFPDKTT